MKKLNVSLVRARNIVEIVTAIAEHEGISRAEIAERASVSVMTVSNIMEVLLRNGAVYETEQRTENVGRNPALVYFSRSKWLMVLDLSGLRFSCGFMTLELVPFEVLTQEYDSNSSYTENFERFLQAIRARGQALHLSDDECIGISVCLPSVYNMETDTTDSFRIPALSNVPIKGTIRKFFDCEIIASADAKLAGIACNAELKAYAPYSLLYLSIDSNVRGALVHEGNVVMGTDGYAGDLGQMVLSCGERLESSLLRAYGELEAIAKARECSIEALWNVEEASKAMEDYVNALASALYNTCCVFSPYAIVLDGQCVRFGDRLVCRLIDYIHPRLVPANRHKPDILLLSHTVSNAVTGAGIRLREKWIKGLN
ncbi:MAG: ROK family transcriptional regulator [Clostridiaceae bacterium]|nr:ROK family transcriptional regulator [Clostridiaceae bacterium]